MHKPPFALDLIETTQELLLSQILPNAAAEDRYAIHMCINALRISQRQLTSEREAETSELQAMARILNVVPEQSNNAQIISAAAAKAVRAGEWDDNISAKLFLWESVLRAVRESNPRYLDQEGIS